MGIEDIGIHHELTKLVPDIENYIIPLSLHKNRSRQSVSTLTPILSILLHHNHQSSSSHTLGLSLPHHHRHRSSLSLLNWSYSCRFTMRIAFGVRKNFIFYLKK